MSQNVFRQSAALPANVACCRQAPVGVCSPSRGGPCGRGAVALGLQRPPASPRAWRGWPRARSVLPGLSEGTCRVELLLPAGCGESERGGDPACCSSVCPALPWGFVLSVTERWSRRILRLPRPGPGTGARPLSAGGSQESGPGAGRARRCPEVLLPGPHGGGRAGGQVCTRTPARLCVFLHLRVWNAVSSETLLVPV